MQLNHPNIIKLHDYSFDEINNNTYIILEYAENGTLFDYIKQNQNKDKDRRIINGIFHSICDAVEYMHLKNIMHRDIKVYNLLLFSRKISCWIVKML